jgi:hypothetical protein
MRGHSIRGKSVSLGNLALLIKIHKEMSKNSDFRGLVTQVFMAKAGA